MEKIAPPPLADVQRWLRWIFTEPRGLRALNEPGPKEPRPRVLDWIADGPPIPRFNRLAVYSDAYFIRLHEGLAANFPALRRVLGAERFRRLAAGYVAGRHSDSPCIDDFGEHIPDFLSVHSFSRKQPFLPDLARLEWNVLCSLYATRRPRLDLAQVQNIPKDVWPKARLLLDPTVRLLQSQWPVDRLWKTRKQMVLRRAARYMLLYRDDEWVQIECVEKTAFRLLSGLHKRKPLGDLMEDAAAHGRDGLGAVQTWFGRWVKVGVITRWE